jgi:hypothetical protein
MTKHIHVMLKLSWYYKLAPSGCWRRNDDDTLFEVEFAIMMLQGFCLKVEFVESVIQILKKAAKLASEAEAWVETLGFRLYINSLVIRRRSVPHCKISCAL